jgi:hypothetical protein
MLGVIWFAFLTMNNTSFAQQNGVIRCATMEQDAILRANNPNLGTLDDMEQMLAPIIEQKKLQAQNPNAHIVDGVYIIPVVVHVVHNGEAIGIGNNISYARIQSQIETLNDDFRRRTGTNGFNTHPDGADTKIEFRLAQRQPNGTAFAEIGVNRINRNTQGWGAPPYTTGFIDGTIKPFTSTTQGYDGSVYMSFWCVPISGGILGYAQFPVTTLGGMSCNAQNTVTDGVVQTTSTVGGETVPSGAGPYNLGRTATHEIGHWLGLRHIWGDGNCTVDDFCADTPLAGGSNFGCATGNNSCTTTPVDAPDMVENYMDYSDDACMNIFTNDQKIRMRTILETSRFSLINSVASIPPNPSDAGVLAVLSPISDVCSSTVTSSIRIKNYGSTALTSVTVQYRIDATAFTSQAFTGLNVAPNATLDLTLNPLTGVTLGNHTFEARTILPNGVADPFTASDLSNSTFTFGNGALPILADFEGADFPPPSWERQNPGNDCNLWTIDNSLNLVGSNGNPTKATLVRHNSYTGAGQEDILVSPSINLTGAGLASAGIEFDLAYRQRNAATSETLRIDVSTDCGATWVTTPLYSKTGTALATTTVSAAAFTPTAANQWRRESVSLNAYLGQSIKVRFVTVNANGNNLWIDNVKIYDARPEIQFTSATNAITENSTSGTIDCRGYQDLNIPVSITIPPASAVTVNIAATGGTMNAQDYTLQTSTLTFATGSTTSQNVVVRVFNDDALEITENLQLTLSVVGTAAITGTNTVHTLTVNDNDDITQNVTQTLFSENFETYTAGAVSGGWTIATVGTANGSNNWVFGEDGGMTGTRSAYITNDATTRPLAYTNTSTSRTRLVSPAINTVGATNLQLSFDFKANGEVTGTAYDYGRLMYSTSPTGLFTAITGPADGTNNGTPANAAPFFGTSASTAYTVTLPAACQNQATLYVVWRWDNDGSIGTNPPFTVDDIVLTGSVLQEYPVENALTSKQVYLGANSTVYVISSTNKVMAKLENTTSHDYGCTTVAIDRVGTGQATYTVTGAANGLTQKSLRITPTNVSTQDVGVTLYYTNAEKTGWETATGLSWATDAKMQRTGGAISAITPATPTANGVTNSNHALTRSAYLTTEHAVKATINNGFGNGNTSGGLAIGDPRECVISAIAFVSQTACVAATNKYTATVTVTYSNPSGSLVVNGQTFATTTSPQTVTLTNLESDGLAVNVTASFSGSAACTLTSNSLFTAPVTCSFTGTVTLGAVAPTTYCAGTTVSVPYTTLGTFGGTNQFTAQLSNSAGVFTTPIATASGVSPISLIIPSNATASTAYKVRVISTAPNSISAEAIITVNTSPTVTLSAFSGVCSTTAAFALSGGLPAGGTYSGAGVVVGNFDPATAGAGTHSITYTVVSGGCSNTATQNIVVSAPTAVTLSAFGSVCSTTATFALSGGLPAGGTYSGTGVSGNNFNPATAGVGTHAITYTVVNGGCSNTATQNIVVSAPTAVTLSAFTGVCSTQAAFALSGGSPAGGTYSGTGVSVSNFDPATAGAGTHVITYTVVSGGCSNTATQNIAVSAPTAVTLSAFGSVCSTTATFALSGGLPAGGTYSGTGISGNNFDPATAGVGTHAITYTVVNGACTNTATQNIVVSTPTAVTLSAFSSVCSSQAVFALSGGSPAGGTYSGAGVSAGNFDPAIAGVGTHTITYTVVNGGCSNSATQNIAVSAPTATVTLSAFTGVCSTQAAFALSGGLPAGGTYSGTGVSAGSFDPATAGFGTHAITYTVVNGGCSNTATQNIVVSSPTAVTLSAFASVCSTQAAFALTGGSPAGGTYSGTGISGNNFDPATAGVGTHAITYTVVNGGCSNAATQNIVVSAPTTVTLSAFASVCSTQAAFALTGGLPVGGTYSGAGIVVGNFDPATAGVGTHTITYTVVNGACTNTATQNIVVSSPPVASFTIPSNICSRATAYVLSGGLPTGGTYSGANVNSATGTFDATAGVGTYTVTYTVTIGTCTSSANATATVIDCPIVGNGVPIITAPTAFTATSISTSQINLSWDAVSGATGYLLYIGNTLIATITSGGTTTFQNTGLDADKRYSYRLIATNGNSQSQASQTNGNTYPNAPIILSNTGSCGTGSAIIALSGSGAAFNIYVEETGGIAIDQTSNATYRTPIISENTVYYISVIGIRGLESARTRVEAVVIPTVELTINEGLALRSCDATTLLIASQVDNATYTWLVNGAIIDNSNTTTLTATRSGNYQVRIIRAGCIITSAFSNVTLNYAPLAQIANGTTISFCENGILRARETANATYSWTFNNTVVGAEREVSVSQSGEYTLTVTENGCSATDQIQVVVTSLPSVSFEVSSTTFCPNEEVTLTADQISGVTYDWSRNGRVIRRDAQNTITVSIGGNYSVTISQSGCSVSSSLINVERLSVEPAYLRTTETTLFVESESAISTIIWRVEEDDDSSLEGQITVTPTESASYSALVTYSTGCSVRTRTVRFNVRPPVVVGEEQEFIKALRIYPNPSASGIFQIDLGQNTEAITLTLTDQLGRILETITLPLDANSYQLDLSKYASALYTLQFKSEKGIITRKIVIDK